MVELIDDNDDTDHKKRYRRYLECRYNQIFG